MPRLRLLLSLMVMLWLATGCALAPPSPEQTRADALKILTLNHAESRFSLAMRELSLQQIERNPQLRPYFSVIDNFWREQVRWPEVREKIINNYLTLYTARELQAIRRALDSPLGDRIGGHAEVMQRELATQALSAMQDKVPALEQHLHAMHNAILTGQTGELTPEQDFAALSLLAQDGDAASQLMLAEKLLVGVGVERNIPQAMRWLETSAAQNHGPAQDILSSFYYRGVGVARDYRKAKELLEKAVTRNYLPAINNLAWLLATCPDDTLRDGQQAVALLLPVMDQSAQMIDTLAAAQAESGNFIEAIALQKQALVRLENTADPRFGVFVERLQFYAAGQAWRDPPTTPTSDDP